MIAIEGDIRRNGGFMRRRDLLAAGRTDGQIRRALAERRIFRVRQGWYSIPGTSEAAVRAVRLGGRLTGVAALETYGLRVPRRDRTDVVVPAHARALRNPLDKRARLRRSDGARVHWTDPPRARLGSSRWRATIDDALLVVLKTEGRDIAVACCSAVMRHKNWSDARMDAVFRRAPARVRRWRCLVGRLDDSHGETFVRLWLTDAGVPFESQAFVAGAGRLDFRVGPHTYIEVDGGQHDPEWTGEQPSSWAHDHDRDATVVIAGGQVLRFIYRQLYGDWTRCLEAIEVARANDIELTARRAIRPQKPRSLRRALRGKRTVSPAPAQQKRRRTDGIRPPNSG